MAENEERLRSFLMRVKEESEKIGLKLNIQKAKIMASGPITSWQIDGDKVEIVEDFLFLGSKITVTMTAAMKLKDACFLEESYDKPKQCIKAETSLYQQKSISQSYDISSSHVWM